MIYLYTDGSSCGRVGDGGYAWIVVINDEVWYAGFGGARNTTNNLMELEGAIKGLEYLMEYPIYDEEGITLISDSQYVLGISDGTYTPQKNLDSAMRLRTYARLLSIRTKWVRGHSGDIYNDAADSMAKMGKRGYHRAPRAKQAEKQKRKNMRKSTQ